MRWFVPLGALVVLAAACNDREELPQEEALGRTPRPTMAAPEVTPCTRDNPACMPDTDDPHPGLTDQQAQRAIELATHDETVSGLLAGVDSEVRGAGVWELRGQLTGAVVTIELHEPLLIDGELPGVDIGARGGEGNETYIELPPPYYIEGMEHHEIEALSIHILVDLKREKVVEIFPLPFSLDGLPTPG